MTTRETELTAQVAALELEVAGLRSVMADVIKAHGYTGGTPIEVMSTPFTPTTLHELIEKVEKIWREKCASHLDSEWNGDADTYEYSEACNDCAERIRALPVGQIKLEELL